MKHNRYVGGWKLTHDVKPSSKQLVLVGEFLVCQQQLAVQLGPFGRA